MLDGVLFDVVDQYAARFDPRVAHEHIQDHARALVLVFQVRRVNEDLLLVPHSQIDVFEEDSGFVACVLIQADLADTQHVGLVEKLRNHGDDFARQRHVLGFFALMHNQVKC